MQKYRVYELAKMFGKTNEEVIRTLQKNNVNVKTNFNSVGEKEKDLLEKAFSGKEPRKNTHRTIRTVRFDRQGRPAGRKADESHHRSYSSYKVEQPQEVKKESNRDTVKTEDRHVSSHRGEERRTSSEHRSYKDRDNNRFSHRSGDRNHDNRERRNSDFRNDSHNHRNGNRSSDRNYRGEGRQDRDQRGGNRNGTMRKRSPAPVETAIPEQPEQQKRFRTPRKKTKKDYEKSRREREGGSLMARSLKQHKKKHPQEKKPVVYPTEVRVPMTVTVKEFADLLKREVSEVIKHLMADGVMATINQNLDRDTVEILADEFGVTLLEPEEEKDLTEYTP